MWSAADASSLRLFADDPRAASRLGTDNGWRTHHGPRRVSDNLPPGWKLTQLQDLAASEPRAITDGPFGSNLKTAHYTSDGPRVVRLQNIGDGVFRRGDAHISQEHYEALIQHAVQAGDLVVASLGEVLPRACLVPDWIPPAIVKADCIRVRLHSDVNPAYVNFALQLPRLKRETAAEIKGVGRPRLGLLRIKQLPIPLAPRAEQDRIVATIEEHFSRLDAVEAAVANTHWRLDALRSITMDRAFYGAGAERTIEIGDFAQVSGGIQKQPKRRPRENRYPFLRVANVGRGQLDLTEVHEIELFEGEIDRLRLKQGDLLVVEGNGSVNQIGRAALWNGEIDDCVHQNHLIRVRPGNELLPEYLAMCWNAPRTSQQVRAVASSTSGLYTLSTSKVKSVCIPIVPLPEQRRIVEQLDLQLKGIELAGMAASNVQTRVRALRRAVLAQAFTGQLVPQSPNDDPASAMLERIEAGAR